MILSLGEEYFLSLSLSSFQIFWIIQSFKFSNPLNHARLYFWIFQISKSSEFLIFLNSLSFPSFWFSNIPKFWFSQFDDIVNILNLWFLKFWLIIDFWYFEFDDIVNFEFDDTWVLWISYIETTRDLNFDFKFNDIRKF